MHYPGEVLKCSQGKRVLFQVFSSVFTFFSCGFFDKCRICRLFDVSKGFVQICKSMESAKYRKRMIVLFDGVILGGWYFAFRCGWLFQVERVRGLQKLRSWTYQSKLFYSSLLLPTWKKKKTILRSNFARYLV